MTRPKCKCHGEPMYRNGRQMTSGRQKWACNRNRRAHTLAVKDDRRRRAAASYRDRKARGVCTKCEGPLLSDALCWDCLNKMEERDASRL